MIKVRMHFTVDGFKDHIDIEGENHASCKQQMWAEIRERGLDIHANNIWTEEIKEIVTIQARCLTWGFICEKCMQENKKERGFFRWRRKRKK